MTVIGWECPFYGAYMSNSFGAIIEFVSDFIFKIELSHLQHCLFLDHKRITMQVKICKLSQLYEKKHLNFQQQRQK